MSRARLSQEMMHGIVAMQGGASALHIGFLASAGIRGCHKRLYVVLDMQVVLGQPLCDAVDRVSPLEGEPVRCTLFPFPVPALGALTKGDAAIADVEAVRRSRGSGSAASDRAPGAVPGRHELLSGTVPEDACMAQHVSTLLHLLDVPNSCQRPYKLCSCHVQS